MTHAISVPTPFTDIAELAESFAPRVDEERVMLPNPEPIPEGEWVQFSVTFADGSPALNGVGRCTGSYDNGDAVAPEHRFDVVLDSLELDEMGQVYFERILMVRAQLAGGAEPTTGEVDVVADEASYAEPGYAEAPMEVDPAAVVDAGAEGVGATFEGAAYDAAQLETETYDAVAFGTPETQDAGAYAEASDAIFEQPPVEHPAFEQSAVEQPVFEQAAEADEVFAAFPVDEPEPTQAWEGAVFEEAASQEAAQVAEDEITDFAAVEAPAPSRAPARSTERLTPPVSAIYELPPPAAPGELPSPHATTEVLTRGAVAATWTPTPMLRPDPSPSSGLFQYGDGGLPQPERPPRPAIDPSLRVMRAPRPGDPVSAPLLRSAAGGAASAAAVAYTEEEEAFEAEAYAEPEAVDAAVFEAEYEAQPFEEAQPGEGETRQVDIGALDADYGEDAFEIPTDDER